MKLYTEEQVYKALWELEHPFSDGKEIDKIVSKLIPIELPSDEYIEKGVQDVLRVTTMKQGTWIAGANWVIEQIKQQLNGN